MDSAHNIGNDECGVKVFPLQENHYLETTTPPLRVYAVTATYVDTRKVAKSGNKRKHSALLILCHMTSIISKAEPHRSLGSLRHAPEASRLRPIDPHGLIGARHL